MVQINAAVVDGGREIVFIERDPATMVTGSLKAMKSKKPRPGTGTRHLSEVA